jgi:hypothetical protein
MMKVAIHLLYRQVTGWTVQGSNPGGVKELFSFLYLSRSAMGTAQIRVQRYRDYFPM